MAFALLDQIRSIFDGDPGVRKVADDPVLSAELLMLFRMILADGTVSESEMAAFRRICREAFGIPEASIDSVIEYLNEFGYETNSSQAIAQFRDLDVERRKLLVRHMAEIAKADSQLAGTEMQLLRRTLDLLDIRPADVVRPQT
ncbi:TerB family tellurite resistance protein [Mesorhizobium sp. M0938]|uniref:TerB family tellurite resistance protein n=1 Tax=unclassified Mesorhizobium TaxID=325217 RepID=UPI003336C130